MDLAVPANVHFCALNFESTSLREGLTTSGFDFSKGERFRKKEGKQGTGCGRNGSPSALPFQSNLSYALGANQTGLVNSGGAMVAPFDDIMAGIASPRRLHDLAGMSCVGKSDTRARRQEGPGLTLNRPSISV
jgi:hypothetical protein